MGFYGSYVRGGVLHAGGVLHCMYSLRDVERRPVLCSFKRIEGGSAYQKNLLRKIRLYILHSSAASLPKH